MRLGILLVHDHLGLQNRFIDLLNEPLRQIVNLAKDHQLLFGKAIDFCSRPLELFPLLTVLLAFLSLVHDDVFEFEFPESKFVLPLCVPLSEGFCAIDLVDEMRLIVEGLVRVLS